MENRETDKQLIAEAVSKARARSTEPGWVTAEMAVRCLREVFGNRQQPADVIEQFMKEFCS